METQPALNLVDAYVAGDYAGAPIEVEEEEQSALSDEDKELLGQLAKAIEAAIETLCVSPEYPEAGTEAEAEGDAGVPGLLKGIKTEEELLRVRRCVLRGLGLGARRWGWCFVV